MSNLFPIIPFFAGLFLYFILRTTIPASSPHCFPIPFYDWRNHSNPLRAITGKPNFKYLLTSPIRPGFHPEIPGDLSAGRLSGGRFHSYSGPGPIRHLSLDQYPAGIHRGGHCQRRPEKRFHVSYQ